MIMHLRHVHSLSGLSFLNPENFEHWQVTKLLASPRVEFSSVSSVCVSSIQGGCASRGKLNWSLGWAGSKLCLAGLWGPLLVRNYV
jgi:hypothetical protein